MLAQNLPKNNFGKEANSIDILDRVGAFFRRLFSGGGG
jgi:hypothetical protein